MTNGWPDTASEESVLLGKLGVYLTSVEPLACHVPLRSDPQFPFNYPGALEDDLAGSGVAGA